MYTSRPSYFTTRQNTPATPRALVFSALQRRIPITARTQPQPTPKPVSFLSRAALVLPLMSSVTTRKTLYDNRATVYTGRGTLTGDALRSLPKLQTKTATDDGIAPSIVALPHGSNSLEKRRKMALLLPGHNEELILTKTIQSAVAAGQDLSDIYVVDDASSDRTREIALRELGEGQVLTVSRSGKAGAVQKAVVHFDIAQRYEWVHVADADSLFCNDYFRIYRERLVGDKYVVAVGFVQSLRGNWISTYRALCYTYSQHVFRRIQSKLGMITVFPGPITSFRTDILKDLDFNGHTVTEDFDLTLQVHRKRLGNIIFIPSAVNYTQDPQSLEDFCHQSMRWYIGFFQGVKAYRLGLGRQRIDAIIAFQLAQLVFVALLVLVVLPYIIVSTGDWMILPVMLSVDFILTSILAFGSSLLTKRSSILGVLPYFYVLRYLELIMYYVAFFDVMILRKYPTGEKGWNTEGRRYALSQNALRDTAASKAPA